MNSEYQEITNDLAVNYILGNTIEIIKYFAGYSEAELLKSKNHLGLMSKIAYPMLNSIIDAQISSKSIKDDIGKIMTPIHKKEFPAFWYVWPNSKPNDLGEFLLDYGFTHGQSSPAMLADLRDLPSELQLPQKVRLERVKDEAMLRDMTKILGSGFAFPKEVEDFFYDMLKEYGFSNENKLQNYLAYLEDEAIACASLFLGDKKVSGIWNVVTLEKARGNGIGTAITWEACYKALQRGYQYSILLSSELGYNVYKRLGFKEYFNVEYYLWQPE